MFCYQCQETAKNTGCIVKGICGKTEETANLQDLLIYVLKGISIYGEKVKEKGASDNKYGLFIARALFATITNANFDNDRLITLIREGLKLRNELK
ncbi:MAG: hydroxylamine reductase, partial [Deltaproteobacteria bacterium]|nr:hydroxylamine reductase [Deltaproteobacteria bacterium]